MSFVGNGVPVVPVAEDGVIDEVWRFIELVLRARGEDAGDGVAVLLSLINAIGKVFHPRQGVVARGVIPVGRLIEAELQTVEQVGFRHHVVMLRRIARVA